MPDLFFACIIRPPCLQVTVEYCADYAMNRELRVKFAKAFRQLRVVIGSLSPAASPLMTAIGRLHIHDKLQHFSAYLALSLLPAIAFKDRRKGLKASLSMFLLGILLEAGQHFSPGRAVELGDVIANGIGVTTGILLSLPLRPRLAIN